MIFGILYLGKAKKFKLTFLRKILLKKNMSSFMPFKYKLHGVKSIKKLPSHKNDFQAPLTSPLHGFPHSKN